jgi:predicted TIM-barrel fold metal-dependent hydrolase
MTTTLAETKSVLDLDSHEQIPAALWEQTFGDAATAVIAACKNVMKRWGTLSSTVVEDKVGITNDNVWQVRGTAAPSAIDLSRRPAVMDEMGIGQQIVFPNFGLFGMNFMYNSNASEWFSFDPAEVDRRAVGRGAIDASNEWAIRVVNQLGDRLRVVAIVPTESPDEMVRDAEYLIKAGIRVLWIPSGTPPARTSPADPALDRFWATCAAANVPVVVHLGTEFAFSSPDWHKNVEVFRFGRNADIEFPIEPYMSSVMHFPCEALLGAMVLGGVFERHPTLRFGVVECGAQWVGPLAEKLDMWADVFKDRLKDTLSMKPSDYLVRNVRATPYFFEDIAYYIERYPKMLPCYAYGSDYPHPEGGQYSMKLFRDGLSRLGDSVTNAFFRENAELIMPE